MARTYTEAQYSTPEAMAMILRWIDTPTPDNSDIERVAVYLSKTLRVGGIKVCRALVVGAISSIKFATTVEEVEAEEARQAAGE